MLRPSGLPEMESRPRGSLGGKSGPREEGLEGEAGGMNGRWEGGGMVFDWDCGG